MLLTGSATIMLINKDVVYMRMPEQSRVSWKLKTAYLRKGFITTSPWWKVMTCGQAVSALWGDTQAVKGAVC